VGKVTRERFASEKTKEFMMRQVTMVAFIFEIRRRSTSIQRKVAHGAGQEKHGKTKEHLIESWVRVS
jgi:hypothetical protein